MHHLKSRGFSGATHAKLIQIGLPNHNASQLLYLPHRRRIVRRPIPFEHAGPTGGGHIGRTYVVLDSDHHSGERAHLLATGDPLVQEGGLPQNGVGVGDVEEGLELGLREPEAGELGLGELGGGDLAGEEGVADGEDLGVWGLGWW